MASHRHIPGAPAVSYADAVESIKAAGNAFESDKYKEHLHARPGLAVSHQDKALASLEKQNAEWVEAMVGQIDEEWWPMWPDAQRLAFLGDMGRIETGRLTRLPVPSEHACSPTLYRMLRSYCRLSFIVNEIKSAFDARALAGATNLAGAGDRFAEWFAGLMTPEEFDALPDDPQMRIKMQVPNVMTEFSRVLSLVEDETLPDARGHVPDQRDKHYYASLAIILTHLGRPPVLPQAVYRQGYARF
ncbi:hypothetical protein DMC30DRAFT_445448 [Rhodotorula diobovata]|uniref:Uncharacterized protein n=1 Tax=Rhodotorula diobovata TaxID=5288 RepID=A0A5C5G141_9BASI|nr:hypothetical protein DMC30DRAFT_445448 [Rhodotorula diobovata]